MNPMNSSAPRTAHTAGMIRGATPDRAATSPTNTHSAGVYASHAPTSRGSSAASPAPIDLVMPTPSLNTSSITVLPTSAIARWLHVHRARPTRVANTGSAR